jgi:hypothetical protein
MRRIHALRAGAGLLAAIVCLSVLAERPARAADLDGTSLKLVPGNVAFYSTMLRNKEQIEIIAKSQAWNKLWNLPVVQMGWKHVEKEYKEGNLAEVRKFFEQAENKELLDVLADAVSNEIFVSGSETWVSFVTLAMRLNGAVQFGPVRAMLEGNPGGLPPGQLQAYFVLKALADNLELIQVPDLMIGFKVSDTKKADAQIKRLEAIAKAMLEKAPPPIQKALKTEKIGGGNFLTLTFDGSLVPWDMVPINDLEMKKGEFAALAKKLKGLEVKLALGVRDGYLLLGLGGSAAHIEALGKGARLQDRAELKPALKFADKRLTSVGYVSKAFMGALQGTGPADLDALIDLARLGLKQTPVPEDRQKKIVADLKTIAGDIKKMIPEAGADLSFSFLTDRGQESYNYSWTKQPELDGSKPLTLLNHVGGNPLVAVVGRSKGDLEGYKLFTKWVKMLYGHADELAKDMLQGEPADVYKQVTKTILPLVKKLDEITTEMLFPALADGQAGFVLDAKWTSKQWHTAIPMEKPMPMLEVGIILGVSDADLLVKAMGEYRKTVNEIIAAVRKLAPKGEIPEFEIPAPKTVKRGTASLFFYDIPAEAGLDKQFVPTAGVGGHVAALTLSQAHTERLLANKPLQVDGGPLAEKRNLAGAVYMDCAGIVDALSAWVDFAAHQIIREHLGPDAPQKDVKAILDQVHTVMEVLKVFRQATSATYIGEDGVVITHSETLIRDLGK